MATSGPRMRLLIDGANLAEDMLTGILERSHDMKPVLRVIQDEMRKDAEVQFVTEGGRSGTPWEKDAPSTIAKKIAAGYPNRTEVLTADLYDSLTDTGGGNSIRRLSRHSTTLGTKLHYAAFQKNPLLVITTTDADNWAERMIRYCLEGAL
jgi:hypothetical protein